MQPGQTFEGRYAIEREIGRGSFGIVYLADDLKSGEHVAIKVLQPAAEANDALRHRLRREARLAEQIKSPHAIRVHHLGETADGRLYLVMEYLEGRELTDELRERGRFEPAEAARVARQVLAALDVAHQLGVIHRDLKPHNIFLCHRTGAADHIKVFDFGIAKVAGTGDGSGLKETRKLTVAMAVLGTPVYMSPEQCRGDELTPASDLYSLGIVLYEMLTGRVPFDDENPVRVMMLHDSAPVPPLPAAIARTPLGRAVLRTLAKDPADRFATAAEFLAALDDRPAPAAAAPTVQKQAAAVASPAPRQPPAPATADSAPKPASAAWVRYLIGAIILLVLIAAIVSQFF